LAITGNKCGVVFFEHRLASFSLHNSGGQHEPHTSFVAHRVPKNGKLPLFKTKQYFIFLHLIKRRILFFYFIGRNLIIKGKT